MAGRIEGQVVSVTTGGDLVTNIAVARLTGTPRDSSVRIQCGEHESYGIFSPNHGEPPSTFLAIAEPSGSLVLTVVDENAHELLAIEVGEKVVLSW